MTGENSTAGSIEGLGPFPELDQAIKTVLANKQILARIMEGFVPEYAGLPFDEIESLIEPDVQVSAAPVEPGMTNLPRTRRGETSAGPGRIIGMNTEDTVSGEGQVRFDIRFTALTPARCGDAVQMVINIEAQNDIAPGYPLVRRGLFYAARLISSQYDTPLMGKQRYDQIKKVYSIWLCPTIPKRRAEERNTVMAYRIREASLTQKARPGEDPRDYDLITVIIAYLDEFDLQKKNDRGIDGALGVLNVLVNKELKAAQKKQTLTDHYGFVMTEELDQEVARMCNVSTSYVEYGLEKGLRLGEAKGRIEGKAEGRAEGIVLMSRDLGKDDDSIIAYLMDKLGMSRAEAAAAVAMH